jgi:hypothetical protein
VSLAGVRTDDLPGFALSEAEKGQIVSALRLHATAALAAKLGGFTKPEPEPPVEPLVLDAWYANIIRRRAPRVLAVNPATLVSFIVPLAPAKTLLTRLPAAIALHLAERGVPADFIAAHVSRLEGGGAVVKTADRRMVGILNRRQLYIDLWLLEDDAEWADMAHRLADDLTTSPDGYVTSIELLADAVRAWRRMEGKTPSTSV